MTPSTNTNNVVGISSGNVMWRNTLHAPQPSMRAASFSSGGMP
jgi:hypothetical protein